MPGIFDGKLFNAEVFQKYVERIPNTRRRELIRSRAVRPRPDLAAALAEQTGGNYLTTPMLGLISGTAAQNYDGQTDLTANVTDSFAQSRVVVGRANGWTERDFSCDTTGGVDFLENVAEQISEYWEEVDQDTIIAILNGVFSMSDTEGAAFVAAHTYDVTAKTNSEGVLGAMDATTLNTGIQKACGDNKGKFSLVIMHSMVAMNLENLKVLAYMKYTDSEGIERDLTLATLNGRSVLVDDAMPCEEVTVGSDTRMKFITYVLGDGAIEYTDCGVKTPYEVHRDPKTHGGEDTLYARQRKAFAPYGISFTKQVMSKDSPTDAELQNGANWELVNNGKTGAAKKTIAHKAIPITRIISLG